MYEITLASEGVFMVQRTENYFFQLLHTTSHNGSGHQAVRVNVGIMSNSLLLLATTITENALSLVVCINFHRPRSIPTNQPAKDWKWIGTSRSQLIRLALEKAKTQFSELNA